MASDKIKRMERLKLLLMNAPAEGLKIEDLVQLSGIPYKNIHRDLIAIGAKQLEYARYTYEPTKDELQYARALLKAAKKKE